MAALQTPEIIYLASKAVDKRWDFEQLKYGDDLYGNEHQAELVWGYVIECESIGTIAFYEKYKEYKLF